MTLFIPTKVKAGKQNENITIGFRAIERWANALPPPASSGITQITSTDASVVITNPTGPTTNLSVPAGSGGGYLSLTGPGRTATPGDLTQAGGFTVNAASTTGISLNSTNTAATFGIQLNSASFLSIVSNGITNAMSLAVGPPPSFAGTTGSLVIYNAKPGGVSITDAGSGTIQLDSTTNVSIIASNGVGHPGTITIMTGVDSSNTAIQVNLHTFNGNPNGSGISAVKGDICFDNFTPGIWIYTGTVWSMYTNP
jgi:hypothetical protein